MNEKHVRAALCLLVSLIICFFEALNAEVVRIDSTANRWDHSRLIYGNADDINSIIQKCIETINDETISEYALCPNVNSYKIASEINSESLQKLYDNYIDFSNEAIESKSKVAIQILSTSINKHLYNLSTNNFQHSILSDTKNALQKYIRTTSRMDGVKILVSDRWQWGPSVSGVLVVLIDYKNRVVVTIEHGELDG